METLLMDQSQCATGWKDGFMVLTQIGSKEGGGW
jgi:hypothetical protein